MRIILALTIVMSICLNFSCTDKTGKPMKVEIDSFDISKKYYQNHQHKLDSLISLVSSLKTIKSLGTPTTIATNMAYGNAIAVNPTAKNLIGAYKHQYLEGKNLFIVDGPALLDYLTKATSPFLNYHFQLFLGYSNQDGLVLVGTCADSRGDHIYFRYNDQNPNSVMKLVSTFPPSNFPFQTPSANPTDYMPSYSNGLLYSSANTLIDHYLTSSNTSDGETSFTIEANHLIEFINKETAAGANKFHIYLGDNNNDLKIIISGYNSNTGKYIYLGNGDNLSCVYEHCDPCPVCDYMYNQGKSLE